MTDIVKIGRYAGENQTGVAYVYHIHEDANKASGFFFTAIKPNDAVYCTWSLDGKAHMGRSWNIRLNTHQE